MANQDAYPEKLTVPSAPQASHAERALERWRGRKHTRLSGARKRRTLVRWLRTIARHSTDHDSIRRRRDVLLHYRAAAVRTDLLEVAALLERRQDPDPDCVAALHELLANHPADSPLYNPHVPFVELQETLDYIRTGLSNPATEAITDEEGRCAS